MTQTTIYLDGLRKYALRDLSKLKSGTEVVFVHLPVLEYPEDCDSLQFVQHTVATITDVRDATFAELHPGLSNPIDSVAQPVIFYREGTGTGHGDLERNRYASDSGVIPYEWAPNSYNSTNFVVLLAELEEQGLTPLLRVSEEYAAELEDHNSKITVYDISGYYYDDYAGDDSSWAEEAALDEELFSADSTQKN